MNETQMILSAIRMSVPRRSPKKIMQEIEPDPLECERSDPMLKMARKLQSRSNREQKHKKKPIRRWSDYDFLRYFDSVLKPFGSKLEGINIRDTEVMRKLYDKLLSVFQERMSNQILKEYIDWWVAYNGHRCLNGYASVHSLSRESDLLRFAEERASTKTKTDTVRSSIESQTEDVDIKSVYDHGGFEMILRTYGIVTACSIHKNHAEIRKALTAMSSEELLTILEVTLSREYNKDQEIDFMLIAKDALNKHCISRFDHIDFRTFFKS